MGGFLVMPTIGSCISMATLPRGSAGPVAISKPVGQGPLARNLSDDVKTIQQALNQVALKGEPGGPSPLLVVDGIKGPKTQAAIFNFQRLQVKGINADGLVEPDKKTILRLNEIAAPLSRADLNAKLAASLPLVQLALTAAIANVTAIITSGPGPTGPAAFAADRLNRHFRLSDLDPSGQGESRITLFQTYLEMSLVVNRPDLFDLFQAEDAFSIDRANPKIALTRKQGVFEPAIIDGADNPARHIRLGLGFFTPSVSPDFAAFIIIHELAHFTGRRDGEDIEDHGRGWFDDLFIRPLKADKRLANADSYASFAHECRTNSALKPAFVKTAPGGLGGRR